MSSTKKKYTLYRPDPKAPKACAFYGTSAGCRSGEKCKFIHGDAAPKEDEEPKKNQKRKKSKLEKENISKKKSDESDSEKEEVHFKRAKTNSAANKEHEKADQKSTQKKPNTTQNPQKTEKKVSPSHKKGKDKGSNGSKPSESTSPKGTAHLDPFAVIFGGRIKQEKMKSAPVSDSESVTSAENSDTEEIPSTDGSESDASSVVQNKPKEGISKRKIQPETPPSKKGGARIVTESEQRMAELSLPISPFFYAGASGKRSKAVTPTKQDTPFQVGIKEILTEEKELHKTWEGLVQMTMQHPSFSTLFDFKIDSSWVSSKNSKTKSGASKMSVLAIDCEMCASLDPVLDVKNDKELIRVSAVCGPLEGDVVLDSLVRPSNNITDYRTEFHGIGEKQLQSVSFTIRHAQAALLQLVDENTIIIGHALHNDLEALKFQHQKVIDTALLYKVKNSTGTPSLRDLCQSILNKSMERHHDSAYDARITFEVAQKLRLEGLKDVEKGNFGKGLPKVRNGLLVHRIPQKISEETLLRVLSKKTSIIPKKIDSIERRSDKDKGKTMVTYSSIEHADLAFHSLSGVSKSARGYATKRIYLKDPPTYIQIRQNFPEKKRAEKKN